jgi:hypothetical protein
MKPHIAVILAMIGLAQAQVYVQPPANKASDGAASSNESSAPASEPASKTGDKAPPNPLGQEIPLLDPSAETITVGGVAIPLGDNRLLRARFDKFLSQPPESNEAATRYRETIAEILNTISPLRNQPPDLYAAFKLLPSASSYPGDANLCGSLAESIYMAMLAKQDVSGLQKLNKSIEDEKQAIISSGDWMARNDRDNSLGQAKSVGDPKTGKSAEKKPSRESGVGANSLKYSDTLKRIAEIEVLKKANIARTEAQTLRTKAQYQVSMVQWFIQRRYEHVLMAARFYNQIWKDGDATLRVDKNSDVSKLFSESVGVSPTVASLDSLSNEAIRETEKYVEAFDMMLSRDELHSASQRLMEAFALGEYLAPVATLSLSKKQRVAHYFRDIYELYGALQARDYTKARELVGKLKSSAKDFPSSKIDSVVAASTLASDLAIEDAKAQLMAKQSDKAVEKIRVATETWPTNPKLEEFRKLVNNSSDLITIRNDFDRLLGEKNFREIARRQYEIAPTIQGDSMRENAFRQIVENLMKIETALGKAAEFSKVGQNYAAWEQLAELREQFPDDPKLGRELELLAPKVADFTRALDRARQFENRTPKQTGTALSWYLKARSIHPQSKFAEQGVKTLVGEILPADSGALDGANNQ